MGIHPQPYDPLTITGASSYSNPDWLTSLAASKLTGSFGAATFNGTVKISKGDANADSYDNRVDSLVLSRGDLPTSYLNKITSSFSATPSATTMNFELGDGSGSGYVIPLTLRGDGSATFNGEVYFPATQAYIGYGGNSNYFGGATYFRPVAGGDYTAYVNGANGDALFEGVVTAQSGRPIKNYFGYTTYYGDAGGYVIGSRFRGPSDTDLGFIGALGTGDTLYSYIIGKYGDEIVTLDNVTKAATFNGAVQVNGFLNIGSTDCRMFRDSGNLYIESDGSINLRDTSTGVSTWGLANDGRTFSKTNVWHSDSDGNPRIVYNGSGGATHFYGSYDFVSSTRGHGFKPDGTIVWGGSQGTNNRGTLSWDGLDKAVITVPEKLDIIASGAARYLATSHEFNTIAKLGDFTVATLPSASAYTGYECNTTDSSVTTFGSTVAGGGSSNVKVRSNGTNWTVAGI